MSKQEEFFFIAFRVHKKREREKKRRAYLIKNRIVLNLQAQANPNAFWRREDFSRLKLLM